MANEIKTILTGNDPNLGRKIEIVPVNNVGVGTGGVILPFNRRHHRLKAKCQCVNYTGGVGQATVKITGGGNDALTVTLTIVNGEPTAVAIVAGGAGYAVNDTFRVVDATGTGAVFTVTAVAAGVVTAATYNAATATASPVNPDTFFEFFKLKVNAEIRNISVVNYTRLLQARGLFPELGELSNNFSEPDRNFLGQQDLHAWDLFQGQKFELLWKIKATAIRPALTILYEYDLMRKGRMNGRNINFIRNPIKYRETVLALASGDNKFNESTLNTGGEPFTRMWLVGATPGQLQNLTVKADSDVKLDGTVEEINRFYQEFGFQFGNANFLNAGYATSNTIKGQYNPFSYFDAAYIADVTGRTGERLQFRNGIEVTIKSAIAQNCVAIFETLPGEFK